MNIECNKEELGEAISKAEKIASKNPTLPVLSCVVLEAKGGGLCVKSTNLDLAIQINLQTKNQEDGVVAVSGSLLSSFLNNLNSSDLKINLKKEGENLRIVGKKGEANIKCQAFEDFPNIPEVKFTNSIVINSKLFTEGFKSVWYAASQSSIKPELSSVYVYPSGKSLVFVSTDSFRLAEKSVDMKKGDDFLGIIIPIKNVIEIVRVLEGCDDDIDILIEKNQIAIKSENIYIVSRVIDGNFPDYKQIIPKEAETEVLVLKNDLSQGLKLSGVFMDSFNQISLDIDPKNSIFEISSKNNDKGELRADIKATVNGQKMSLSVNNKHLGDCLNSIQSESVSMGFLSSNKPVVLKGTKDTSFLYLVMPLNK